MAVAVKAKIVQESTPDGDDAAKLFANKSSDPAASGSGSVSGSSNDVKRGTTEARMGNDSIFARLAYNEKFVNTTLFVIVLNAFWIGIDTEWNHDNLKTDEDGNEIRLDLHDFFLAGENFFCIYFVFELVVRFLAFKRKTMAFDLSDKWFIFDSVLVTFMVLETWIMPIIEAASGGDGAQMPGLSVFRLLRLLRLTRMARIMRAVPELMTLIKGMVAAVRSASVILFFLLGVMYVFAIVFTSMLSGNRPEGWCQPMRRRLGASGAKMGRLLQDEFNPDEADENGCVWGLLDDGLYDSAIDDAGIWTAYSRFSSIGSSMMSLFTNGVLGDNLAWCLKHVKHADMFLYWLFIAFMLLSSWTLLNMLIGVLCDVIAVAADDEKEETQLAKFRESLEVSFDIIDASAGTAKNGLITEDEWHQIKKLDSVKESFIELGIEERDLDMHLTQLQETLFHHQTGEADEDGSSPAKNGLTFEKFYKKIIDLRPETPAAALDVEMMKMMVTSNEKSIKKQMDEVQRSMMKVVEDRYGPLTSKTDADKLTAPKLDAGHSIVTQASPKDIGSPPPWWLKDVSNELLFSMLKSREQSSRR